LIQSLSALASGRDSRVLTSITVMVAVIMVVLDMTVVNVALPHMMGTLGATPDQITWVLTAYIVASAVVIPLSGFLAERFGRRNLLFASITGFTLASALCGQAQTLTEIVIFRMLQGASGASVIPLSQSIMVDSFERESRGKAMAIWGIGIMIGPILGPTVGGFITDHFGWQWVFYINVPIGLLNLALVLIALKPSARTAVSADWLGAALLAVGIGSLQTLLDRGNSAGWFDSPFMVTLAGLSIAGISLFASRSGRPDAILKLELLKDRNLAAASFMILAFGLGMFGTIALQPIFLEHLLGYPASTAGLVMAPRGIAVAVGMVVVSILIRRIEPRWLVLTGLLLASAGSYVMTWYTLDVSPSWIIAPGIVQGIGLGMVFVPLSTLAYQTLPEESTDRAASIFNLSRTIGGSIGIAIAATMLTRESDAARSTLVGNVNPFNWALQDWLGAHRLSLDSPVVARALDLEITRQATMIGFLDAFLVVTLSFLVLVPVVVILKTSAARVSGSSMGAVEI
jgi:DHA2 family multidrug resistance protein